MADISVATHITFSHGVQKFPDFSKSHDSLSGMDLSRKKNHMDSINELTLAGNDEAASSTNLSSSAPSGSEADIDLKDVSKKLRGICVTDNRTKRLSSSRGYSLTTNSKRVSFASIRNSFEEDFRQRTGPTGLRRLSEEYSEFPDVSDLEMGGQDSAEASGIESGLRQDSDKYSGNPSQIDSVGAVDVRDPSYARTFNDVWANLRTGDGGSLSDGDAEEDEEQYAKNPNLARAASDMLWQLRRFEVLGASHGTPKAVEGQEVKLQKKASF